MAVALGFDAPRAFVLVALRRVRDPDFGVQLVGRILRVDRRLQGREKPPRSTSAMLSWQTTGRKSGLTNAGRPHQSHRDRPGRQFPASRVAVVSEASGLTSIQYTDSTRTGPLIRCAERVGRSCYRGWK
jgi:superfamily II DNA or RNA helicase